MRKPTRKELWARITNQCVELDTLGLVKCKFRPNPGMGVQGLVLKVKWLDGVLEWARKREPGTLVERNERRGHEQINNG